MASCTPASPFVPSRNERGQEIAIASDLPTSGADGLDARPLRDAIDLAIHDRGTVSGFRLIHLPFDDALIGVHDPGKAEQNVKLMIRDSRIVALIGPYNSSIARVEIPLTNQNGLVMVSPSNTWDCLTTSGLPCSPKRTSPVNNYFRTAASDAAQARAAARFAVRKLGVSRFAVLTDGTNYGNDLAEAFSGELMASGGALVFRQSFSANTSDYRPLLHDARNAGAEAVFVGGTVGHGGCRIREAMSGVFPADAYMLGGDGLSNPSCATDAGTGANGHLLVMISDSQPATDSKVFKEFVAHHIRPVQYAFGAYDCAQIVIDAIDRAIQANGGRVPTRSQVLAAVAATRGFRGATATFTFQPDGNPTAPGVSVYRIQNGSWSFWQNAS